MTENGPKPNLGKIYGLKESHSSDYKIRTKKNIIDSDLTLVIGDIKSSGSRFTVAMCFNSRRPAFNIHVVDFGCSESPVEVAQWITTHYKGKPLTINVAGNRESVTPGIGLKARLFLTDVFKLLGV